MDTLSQSKIAFIIAHKYFRGYESYLNHYVENIMKFYNDSLIIIVDNNSANKEDVLSSIKTDANIVILDNDIECKFELGAYQVGIKYLQEHNLIMNYNYFMFTQDTYVLKNKFDINSLISQNVYAGSIIGLHNDWAKMDVVKPTLELLGLYSNLTGIDLCWCNSFIVVNHKILELYNYIKNIIITVRHQSEASERYLGKILYELNDHKNYSIDGNDNSFIVNGIKHDCHSIKITDEIDKHFCKIAQQKNERTREK